jgi:hypothetical protein
VGSAGEEEKVFHLKRLLTAQLKKPFYDCMPDKEVHVYFKPNDLLLTTDYGKCLMPIYIDPAPFHCFIAVDLQYSSCRRTVPLKVVFFDTLRRTLAHRLSCNDTRAN